jgi:hypothetical protein
MTDLDLWDEAVQAVQAADTLRFRCERWGWLLPPHCVLMRNRYSRELHSAFYFSTFVEAREFMRLLRRANYAGTAQTDYTLIYRSDRP